MRGALLPCDLGYLMLNIESILRHIKNGIVGGNERFVIIDDEHVIDNATGIKLHIYDDWFKVTHDDDVIATMRDFDIDIEQPIVWEIKALITPAELMEKKKSSYMSDIRSKREKLSGYFESPEPIVAKQPIVEEETTEYTG